MKNANFSTIYVCVPKLLPNSPNFHPLLTNILYILNLYNVICQLSQFFKIKTLAAISDADMKTK